MMQRYPKVKSQDFKWLPKKDTSFDMHFSAEEITQYYIHFGFQGMSKPIKLLNSCVDMRNMLCKAAWKQAVKWPGAAPKNNLIRAVPDVFQLGIDFKQKAEADAISPMNPNSDLIV